MNRSMLCRNYRISGVLLLLLDHKTIGEHELRKWRVTIIILLVIVCLSVITRIYIGSHPQLMDQRLRLAISKNDTKTMNILIALGANVNWHSPITGFTPLYRAATLGHRECCEVLISHGADVNARDNTQTTPLHWATIKGDRDTCVFLISKGADVNALDMYGLTPLYRAAMQGNTEICSYLISQGANVNAKGQADWTPLHHAVLYSQEAVCALLIRLGADVNTKDSGGGTPMSIAKENGLKSIVVLLKTHGGK